MTFDHPANFSEEETQSLYKHQWNCLDMEYLRSLTGLVPFFQRETALEHGPKSFFLSMRFGKKSRGGAWKKKLETHSMALAT